MSIFNKRQVRSGRLTVRMRPSLEALEGRVVLSTIVVNNPTDTPVTGKIDLRQAIVEANTKGGTETITFDSKVFKTPQTITLTGGELVLSDPNGRETITGPKTGVTVSGNNLSRVFLTESGKVAISNVVIEHGQVVGQGGGLLNDGATDTLTSVQFFDDFSNGRFGGNGPSGKNDGSVGTNGQAGGAGGAAEGGAICNLAGSLTLTNCFFNANEAIGGDGGHGGAGGFGGGANRSFDFNGLSGFGGAGGAGGAGARA